MAAVREDEFFVKFIKKISSFFSGSGKEDSGRSLWISVQCDRCSELIRTRIDLSNDLTAEFGEGEGEAAFFCRKVLIGNQGCYVPVEVLLKFDARRRLTEKQVSGGKFMEG
jgi:hypothetical protein